ncbi:MAG TPA: hypothetical protein VJ552_03805 [Sediminibacterium sp.]|nr:hypothetical protein [Sediminibacterium sp.]
MTITISEIQLFQLLKPKLGDQEAEALVNFVDAKLNKRHELDCTLLATREDLAKEAGKLENKITETEVKIAETEARLIRWMCAAFIALMSAIIGLYFK